MVFFGILEFFEAFFIDLKHVKADHSNGTWARTENSDFLGEESDLYPLKDMKWRKIL